MKCVKCEGQLLPTQAGGVEVDRCQSCQGIWFDVHEITVLLKQDPRTLAPMLGGRDKGTDTRPGKCPRDGSTLAPVTSARDQSTRIDVCLECGGIWLDAGELDALLEASEPE